MLLFKSADYVSRGCGGGTALRLPSKHVRKGVAAPAVVGTPLGRGLGISLQDRGGDTALRGAMQSSVEVLLENKAERNLQNIRG